MTGRQEPRRVSALKRLMAAEGIEALLVSRREDVRYLSGFTGSAGVLLIATGRPCLITDFRYQLQAARETTGVSVRIQQKDLFAELRDAVVQAKIEVLAFDTASLTVAEADKLRRGKLRTQGREDLVGRLRLLKDRREVGCIRQAIRRAEEALRRLKRSIAPGVTERELAVKLESLMREAGARRPAFDTIVASGRNGALPHATVTNRRIRKGDLVTFDFGAEAQGYYSDITRTYCVGRPSARQREIHDLVRTAQEAAVRAVLPGTPCAAVDRAAREVIERAGRGTQFGHGTGHGVGLMVHEGPSISRLSEDRVAGDMVFTIEPGVYVPDWGGVRIEDMVRVTEKGAAVLTTLPREIDGLARL